MEVVKGEITSGKNNYSQSRRSNGQNRNFGRGDKNINHRNDNFSQIDKVQDFK